MPAAETLFLLQAKRAISRLPCILQSQQLRSKKPSRLCCSVHMNCITPCFMSRGTPVLIGITCYCTCSRFAKRHKGGKTFGQTCPVHGSLGFQPNHPPRSHSLAPPRVSLSSCRCESGLGLGKAEAWEPRHPCKLFCDAPSSFELFALCYAARSLPVWCHWML